MLHRPPHNVRVFPGVKTILGLQPLNLLEGDELDRYLAEFTPGEQDQVREFARRYARVAGILALLYHLRIKAEPYTYDPEGMDFITPAGRKFSAQVVRAEIRRMSFGARDELRALAVQYKNGEIALDEWYQGMRSTMKSSYRAAVDYARGSGRPFTPQEKGRFGQAMKKQYEYLNRFARDLRDGKIPLDGRFVARAGMYGDALNAMYENWRKAEAVRAGFTEERRVLQAAEHCHDTRDRPGCAELAEKGWQPIGTLPAIGAAACYSMCRCFFEYKKGG